MFVKFLMTLKIISRYFHSHFISEFAMRKTKPEVDADGWQGRDDGRQHGWR